MGKGIRQSCPLSPYIFILCIECLDHFIHDWMSDSQWKPIQIRRRGLPISHLMFMDDLLLFAKATTNQMEVVRDTLQQFYDVFGGKVSMVKIIVFFSWNVSMATLATIKACYCFMTNNKLGRYLGVPLLH